MRMLPGLVILLLCFGGKSYAQETTSGNWLVAPSVFYYGGLRKRTSKDEKSYLVYELKFGYQAWPNVYAGINYQKEEETLKTSGYAAASLNNSSKGVRTSLGPFIGWVEPTWHVLFTYFYSSKWNLDTTTSTGSNKYAYEGSGMQLDFGYKIQLGPVLFGPQLSYKSYSYSNLSTDGGAKDSISPKLEETGFEPSLVAFYFF